MKPQTSALRAGNENEVFGSMAVPLYQSSAYDFKTSEVAANRFALKELGPIYTRLNNPTVEVLEKRLAILEKGAASLATASGQAAIFYAVANLARAGDNILVANKIYGGATTLLTHTLKNFGIEARLFDSDKANDLEEKIDENSKAIFFESLSNPHVCICEFEAIAKIAKKYSIVTICDNTVATPTLCNPLELGCDIVVHSISKYIGGQGLCIGGALIEREGLNSLLINNPKYPQFNTPDPSYHGLVYADLPFPIFTLRARLSLLRDLGASIAPFNAWQFIQGLETLAIRMRAISDSALKVATYLSENENVKLVLYPGLKTDPSYEKLCKYFNSTLSSGLIHLELKDENLAKELVDKTKLFSVVVNIGDSKSLITHPASTTHQQLSKEALNEQGINPKVVRLSIGLEDPQDLIEDLKNILG